MHFAASLTTAQIASPLLIGLAILGIILLIWHIGGGQSKASVR